MAKLYYEVTFFPLFEKKKGVYQTSQYKMTNSIKASEWNPVVLKQRQEKLAKIAASVWKVDY